MSYGTIRLEPGEELFGEGIDGGLSGWWIDDNVVSVRTTDGLTRWRLPKGQRKVALHRLGRSKARLMIGGFKTITVEVVGPQRRLEDLMEVL